MSTASINPELRKVMANAHRNPAWLGSHANCDQAAAKLRDTIAGYSPSEIDALIAYLEGRGDEIRVAPNSFSLIAFGMMMSGMARALSDVAIMIRDEDRGTG